VRRTLFAATVVGLGALVVHALTHAGGAATRTFFTDDLYLALELAGVAACTARVVLVRAQRAAWACIAAALACWTAGDAVWILTPDLSGSPSSADLLYLLFFPLCCGGMALLLAGGRDRVAARMWVDGLLAALSTAALAVALAFETIVHDLHGGYGTTIVNLAYPVGDLVLVGFVLTAFATQAWRPGRGWALLGLGAALTAIADTIFLYQDAVGAFHDGGLVDALWPASLLCCGWAAWQPWKDVPRRYGWGRQTFAFPTAFAVLALGLLAYGQFATISPTAALLATAALGVAIVRAGITFHDNVQMIRATRQDALTDGLTGLPNRRRLMHDLERTVERAAGGRTATFAFFDLDGFKGYNDTFGHGAGDMLLDRLASRLASVVADHGRAYRLGGDEFCVLLDGAGTGEAHDALLGVCGDALRESGEGFRVGASCGAVAIPSEASSATQALQLADQRMYAAKRDGRASSRRQTRDVLLQVLREREPELHTHLRGVAALAVAVGRELALTAEQLDEVARAAELHDIGKLAIPDEILHKPGALDDDEWQLMRQHTIIGDRILAAAPAMRPVADIVRATHERYGGGGYPDGRAGEQIPLGARIVSVCDAFHAMTSERPYKRMVDIDDALAELRRCSGTQFDPAVVAVFELLVRSRTADVDSTHPLPL
jgi:diguanylate cyclase (GGDEF)-like protein